MIPESLIKHQSESEDGRRWLDSLPALIDRMCVQWELQAIQPVDTDGSCSWVAWATRRTAEPVIIKIGLPHRESRDEALGLTLWNRTASTPTVALDAHDQVANAMLLEPCIPGVSLKAQAEDQQDSVVCAALRQLWVVGSEDALACGVRELGEMLAYWCAEARARQADGPYGDQVETGCEMFQTMLASTNDKCLLATDLHAGNILSASRSPWLVIDPKPFVGDPAYDLTQHCLNCQARLEADPVSLVQRLAGLSGCDATRIAHWLAARLLTDDGITEKRIDVANTLSRFSLG